jgi:mono/diheme cytochrome c family protein
MKTTSIAIITGIGILVAGSAAAAEHKTPDAPQNYLAMKNPLKDTKAVVESGAKIYEKKCKKCHGDNGDGKGSASGELTIKPASFSKPGYLKGRADGQLFFILEKGSPDTDMDDFGPGSATNLSKDELWSVVAYIRKTFTK